MQRVRFSTVAATIAIVMISAAAPSPLYPVYQRLWGFSSAMLTVVFAVYVGGLLLSLLTVGALSDHVGRKPVAVTAVLMLAVSMLMFIVANGTGMLLAARVVQGAGTGLAQGTLSAALADLQPSRRTGSLTQTITQSGGLGAGVVISAVLVQYAPDPRFLVYEAIAAALILLAVAVIIVVPETSPRTGFTSRAHVARVLTPKISIPAEVRTPFLAGVPALIATWSLAGLDLSLGSSIVSRDLGIGNVAAGGTLLAGFFFAAAIAAPRAGSSRWPVRLPLAYSLLGAGLILQLAGALTGSAAVYMAGLAVAGAGFSTAYAGVLASVAHAPAAQRGRMFAAMFTISYLAYSVPALIGGLAADTWGLRGTTAGYTAFVLAMVALAATALRLQRRRDPGPAPAVTPWAQEPGTCHREMS
ncbi:MAG: MFS transporter [Streptosporangiales bacterium]|nr:MFS transporter [Streptosporangiales bacterium]